MTGGDLFDEAGYLRLYPGIAEAIMRGEFDSAWRHYDLYGRDEGRVPNDVDPDFYRAAYPDAAGDPATHYLTRGRGRGYRPNARAPRPTNGAAMASPFGGFWTDQGNAPDAIDARLDLGRINQRDAARLRRFALDGFVELDRDFDRETHVAAALAVDLAFTGMGPELVFAAPDFDAAPVPWRPELTAGTAWLLDPHMVSGAIRRVVLDRSIADFLALLFDARPCLTATRATLREARAPRRDAAWYKHSLPLQFVAVTFALEDTGAGSVTVWPGSHRLPGLNPAAPAYKLPHSLGAATVLHANLLHAAESPEPPSQRRALTAWYCPSFATPAWRETIPARAHVQDRMTYTSGIYPLLAPREEIQGPE